MNLQSSLQTKFCYLLNNLDIKFNKNITFLNYFLE